MGQQCFGASHYSATGRFEWTLSPEDLQISMWDDDSNESDSMQVGDMNWDVDFLGKVRRCPLELVPSKTGAGQSTVDRK